jgi:hypothetical protein
MTVRDVRNAVSTLAGIFIGGTTEFKQKTAREWKRVAVGEGKRLHFARVSSSSLLDLAIEINSDSVDSSQPLWSSGHFDRFVCRIAQLRLGL